MSPVARSSSTDEALRIRAEISEMRIRTVNFSGEVTSAATVELRRRRTSLSPSDLHGRWRRTTNHGGGLEDPWLYRRFGQILLRFSATKIFSGELVDGGAFSTFGDFNFFSGGIEGHTGVTRRSRPPVCCCRRSVVLWRSRRIKNIVDRCLLSVGDAKNGSRDRKRRSMLRIIGKAWKGSRLWCYEEPFKVLKLKEISYFSVTMLYHQASSPEYD
ncbi:hypothetical protein OSB04_013514 [Centaurea solstitialis]|uniref:Uncharacterized protein n=1 Tax=Centaurea solstitialis TaxID=347529 RepID=A0AA38TDE2_9ASTR|nr:hypothetical protein OSB04_013514 [Centaurea solstitialis]